MIRYRRLPSAPVLMLVLTLALGGCGSRGELQFLHGEHRSWPDYRGQWVVVNYWAEWCKPCLKEIPELNQLSAQAHVQVLGVNFDGLQGEELQRAVDGFGIEFETLTAAPLEVMGHALPEVLPTTYVYDPQGMLRHTLVGPQTLEGLLQLLEPGAE